MNKDTKRHPHDWFIHPIERGNGMKECFCGEPIEGGKYGWYPHDGGVAIDGEIGRQWLYVECRKCGYCWSFQHLKTKE